MGKRGDDAGMQLRNTENLKVKRIM